MLAAVACVKSARPLQIPRTERAVQLECCALILGLFFWGIVLDVVFGKCLGVFCNVFVVELWKGFRG